MRHDPAAELAARLAEALIAAGYDPQEVAVRVERSAAGALELRVQADVPGLDEAALLGLLLGSSKPVSRGRRAHRPDGHEPGVAAQASAAVEPTAATEPSAPSQPSAAVEPTAATQPGAPSQPGGAPHALGGAWVSRLAIALVCGLALGVVGLPGMGPPIRLTALPFGATTGAAVQNPTPEAEPTAAPTATLAPSPTPDPVPFAGRMLAPLDGWPNQPQGAAWFGPAGYHLFAREAGHFVAVGVPLAAPLSNVTVTAHMRKVDGPSGGGYGIIVRDQAPPAARDGHDQEGRFVLLEVGDQGDVAIWQRDDSHWQAVVPWVHSAAVKPELEPNELVVTSDGPALHFEVNSTRVADVSVAGLPTSGGVGVFAGGDVNHVVIDWLRVERLP